MKLFPIFLLFSILSNQKIKAQKTDTVIINSQQTTPLNREIQPLKENEKTFLRAAQAKLEGLIVLNNIKLKNGEVVVKMRGKDIFQASFLGIAFNIENDSTYEAVYCRPFNFFAKDSVRRIHAIQYIAQPKYTWKFLRENKNAEFESEIINPPNPNDWFTMKLQITKKKVIAFINDNPNFSLIVPRLSIPKSKRIALFVADNSGGDFEYVIIKK